MHEPQGWRMSLVGTFIIYQGYKIQISFSLEHWIPLSAEIWISSQFSFYKDRKLQFPNHHLKWCLVTPSSATDSKFRACPNLSKLSNARKAGGKGWRDFSSQCSLSPASTLAYSYPSERWPLGDPELPSCYRCRRWISGGKEGRLRSWVLKLVFAS